MKILLADIANENIQTEKLFSHLGLAYLAASANNSFPDLEFKITQGNPLSDFRDFKPDLVGLSSVSQNFELTKKYAAEIKKIKDIPVIVGGTHISCLPDNLTDSMDIGVIGEGEQTFVELIKELLRGGKANFNEINGIAFRKNGKLVTTPPRELIRPLDQIPFPDRSLLDIDTVSRIHLFSSRGCPYRCSFCSSSRFWNRIRYFSPEYIIRELDEIINVYKPNQIVFYDDLFIVPKKRFKKIVELINNRGYQKKVEFVISARANLVDEDNVKLLKEMNVCSVNLGLESGSDNTLKKLKAAVTVADNEKAVKLLNRAGIQVNASFIIGAIGETNEDIEMTYKFIKNNSLNIIFVYPLTPLPGTPIWEQALELGLVDNEMNWDKLGIEFSHNPAGSIMLTDSISRNELTEHFKNFDALIKRKRIESLLKNSIRNPRRIIPFIKRNIFSA